MKLPVAFILFAASSVGLASCFLPQPQLGWIRNDRTQVFSSSRDSPVLPSGQFRREDRRGPPGGGNPNFRRDRPGQGRPQQRRSNGPGGPRQAGGGGAPALKLENPLKIQRVVVVPQKRQSDDRSNQRTDRRPPRSSPGGTASTRPKPVGAIDQDGEVSSPDGAKRPRKVPGKPASPWKKRPDDGANRKTSLRLGTGKRGRSAEKNQRRGSLKRRDRSAQKARKEEAAIERKTVHLPEGSLTVSEMADMIDEKPISVIKFLMTDLGVMASMTQSLDQATCVAVAEGFGRIVGGSDDDFDEDEEDYDDDSVLSVGYAVDEDDPDDMVPRSPVITIMGHVDHGKTSLLDAIRDTKVTAGEAGGITQHIAAYQVKHKESSITFIDTPGHAAFTDMRERGANITDIVILVVAADDGVKAQTADSIVCARQAGVPIVVAINKCDLETADPSKVLSELTSYDILAEGLGGDVLTSEISAKTGTNLDDLLDKIMLQADLLDLKANADRNAQGAVVEARVERGLGTVATTLIQKGTIKIGDFFVAGTTCGRVKALIGTDGKTRYDEAGPSVPINVVGFDGVPSAGDLLVVVDDEQAAKDLADNRQRFSKIPSWANELSGCNIGGTGNKDKREMCVVVKADVQGSAEALTRSLRELKLEDDEAIVTVKVLVSETGEVTKSDVAIAGVTPDTTVLAFGVAASMDAMDDARLNNIPIEYYSIIYDAIESIESRMQEVLSPTPEGEYVGAATVQEVFNIGGTGNIAGSRCSDGYLRKGANVRVMRGDKILVESKVKSLRNFKSEVDRIDEGNECGIGLVDFEDFEPGDVVECYVQM